MSTCNPGVLGGAGQVQATCCTAGGLGGGKAAAGGQVAAATTLSSWVSMMPGAQALADSMDQDSEPLMPGGLNLVLMGPPLSGKSVQAQRLSERYQLLVTTVDDLLMVSSPLKRLLGCCLGVKTLPFFLRSSLAMRLHTTFSSGVVQLSHDEL